MTETNIEIETQPAKRRLFFEWMGVWVLGTWVFTALRVLHLSIVGTHGSPLGFNPWEDLIGMYQIAPLGWAILGLLGPLWLVVAGNIGVLKTRCRWWHIATLLGTIIFGYNWPTSFWAWMSV
jgi:hypothetical protein